ncbi:hypothetical protein [Nocardia colli]|uniref:hypothetical protein n=1 Tax=Nocardia colli TaxID=2545717 RepID=UPI0035DCB470
MPDSALTAAYWKAARFGMNGDGFDPWTARSVPAGEQLSRLLDHLTPILTASGDRDLIHEILGTLLTTGNGASRQLRSLQNGVPVPEIVAELSDATLDRVDV